MIMQKRIRRSWSFSGLATMIRIMLMYYMNIYTFLENPEKDWAKMLEKSKNLHQNRHYLTKGACLKKSFRNACLSAS